MHISPAILWFLPITPANTGVGEAPGGEVIYQTLVDAILMVLGQEVARLNKVAVQQVHKGNQAADFDTFGKGAPDL